MIDFNFEHFFEEEPDFQEETNTQITYQERPSLAFLQKESLPLKSKIHIDKLELSTDMKKLFQPTIEDKKNIIEDFFDWCFDEEYNPSCAGVLGKYIKHLKSRC